MLRDDAERERDRPALPEGVDAEARQALVLVGDIEVAGLVEAVALVRRGFGDLLQHRLEVAGAELLLPVEWRHRAVAAQDRRLADLEMDVARAEVDAALEDGVQVHGAVGGCIGSPAKGL